MNTQTYRSIVELASDAIVVANTTNIDSPNGPQIVFVNESFTKMTGYTKKEIIGKTPRILHGPDTDRKELNKLREALESGEPGQARLVNYKKNGEKFWSSISIFPINNKVSESRFWVGIKRDITDRIKLHENLAATIQELHHRVKNNLALLSGLMELQANDEKNEIVKKELQAITSRIKSIANIHELLYASDNLNQINIKKGIERILDYLLSVYQAKQKVNTTIRFYHISSMNINQAVPLCLILNEVIRNSVVHGFNKNKTGKIDLILSQNYDKIQLRIMDNGKGFPKEVNPSEANSTGLLLIRTLSKQLKAKFNYKKIDTGTMFSLHFTKEEVEGIHSLKYYHSRS